MKFCVIGLGHFGQNLALSLAHMGAEVMALDVKEENVGAVQDDVSYAATLNAADPVSLKMLPLQEMDAVIVAIGDNFEDSLLTTAYLQEIGVKRVITRVINPVHEKLLRLMKVQDLILPEEIAALRLAKSLVYTGILGSYEIGKGHGVAEIKCPEKLVGKTLIDSNFRTRYQLILITIKRLGGEAEDGPGRVDSGDAEEVMGVVEPAYVFRPNDVLVVFGTDKAIRNFSGI